MTSTLQTSQIVWSTADKFLRNVVEEEDYGDYILPFTVLRRLECMLEPTKAKILAFLEQPGNKNLPEHLLNMAMKAEFGLGLYNVSPLSLGKIAATDDNVARSVLAYVDGFSSNISDVWASFDFANRVATLAKANRLHGVVAHFANIDLSPGHFTNSSMGDIFEDVMYRAFNKKGKAAGAFYTPRDAIRLMVDILFASDDEGLAGDNPLRSIYDPTAGSGGMLLTAQQALEEMNPGISVTLAGQELMDAAYALGKADLLIQGGRPDAIKQGNTLTHDLYEGQTFDYVLSNPPFGGDWSADAKSVKEQAKTPGTRFSHGLPSTSDGQMLFLAHCAHKLTPAGKDGSGGRAAVVSNASPLFNSDNGPTGIRDWLLSSDLIDAIIALPTQMFYGTGIATYVWILDTNKEAHRKGKVQLIDGSGLWQPLRKSMGDKRREVGDKDREAILDAYKAFEDGGISRVMTPEDFKFLDIPVYQQARLATQFSDDAVAVARENAAFTEAHIAVMKALDGSPYNELPASFPKAAKTAGLKAPAGLIDAVMAGMGVPDDAADPALDRKGNPVVLDGFKVTERVALTEDVDEHMEREVLPFAPDAQWDLSKAKPGNEIPLTRLFYVPEEPRPLVEIDAEVQALMGELAAMFEAVKDE